PKIAMSVLSASAPEKVAFAIAVGDAKGIIAPGIGKKLADRIVLELKNKVGPAGEVPEDYCEAEGIQASSLSEDAMKALISLGYTRLEAENAVRRALKEEPAADLSRVIRMALGTFAGKR
ncbi:MAG TPA: helix-hairpin-helix domain-containing protein, partial [Bacillota bacterium]|nr:helix-hairpin-helix domain-containing protein [Bacillota bacterium]